MSTLPLNISDFAGWSGDGVADDYAAFDNFNQYALIHQGSSQIILTIPRGSTARIASDVGTSTHFTKGIKNLIISGYGASFVAAGGTNVQFGGEAFALETGSTGSALVNTVAAGASSATLIDPTRASIFHVGRYAMLGGIDLQGTGAPPNNHFLDYVKITDVTGSVVSFDRILKNPYKSTWPRYDAGGVLSPSAGGAATLYALDPTWDMDVEIQGLTISQAEQFHAAARNVIFRDITCNDSGNKGPYPTACLTWSLINGNIPNATMECDKAVGSMLIDRSKIYGIDFQSSSIDLCRVYNSNITNFLHGTPKLFIARNTAFAEFWPGASKYGASSETICDTCSFVSIAPNAFGDDQMGIQYTMSGGVLTVPKSHGPATWAVPGGTYFFAGKYANEGIPFTVTDITEDGTNTYIHTSLAGGFPLVPRRSADGALIVFVHPAPRQTFIDCTGSAQAVDLSQARPGQAFGEYSRLTYTAATLGTPGSPKQGGYVWGNLVSLKVTVSPAYTGGGALTFKPLAPSGGYPVIKPDQSEGNYDPVFNIKAPGTRTISISGGVCTVTGAQSGDSGLATPGNGAVWFPDFALGSASADVSGSGDPVSVTVEIITDQGHATQTTVVSSFG